MWWRAGFPGVVEGAPWQRAIRGGGYGLIQDTQTLALPHLGPLADGAPLHSMPDAELEMTMVVDGKTYRCVRGGEVGRFTGPRLIESGRFLQRTDVTDLVFESGDGERLNGEMRLETVAWADRLGFFLHARPGERDLVAGEGSFGRVGGGFGLNAESRWVVPREDTDAMGGSDFTLEFWVFPPIDFRAGEHTPWLVCKNGNELSAGNFGILVQHEGGLEARFNPEGGKEGMTTIRSESRQRLRLDEWNHLALSAEGATARLFLNGQVVGECDLGRTWTPAPGALTFGGRGDAHGDGYPFRGVIDEVRWHDRALSLEEIRRLRNRPEAEHPGLKPARSWSFDTGGVVSLTPVSETWRSATMTMRLKHPKGAVEKAWQWSGNETWQRPLSQSVGIWFDPAAMKSIDAEARLEVTATEHATQQPRLVTFDPTVGWHAINLDGIGPIPPPGAKNPSNDAIERVRLTLRNPTDTEQIARLMFEKTSRGIHQRIGTPITGITALLRDADGFPTGIPVQLSKNWHNDPEGGDHSGQWFHGISQLRLPPNAKVNLELVLAYGHWGGVPAASHAQLSLIGWGGNQLWDQAALGSWGESICFEPEQIQRGCTITDVRPLMVRSKKENTPEWGWTNNVGGGDFWVIEDKEGVRRPNVGMRTDYLRSGPCLTETVYVGGLQGLGVRHRTSVSLSRRDDLVCATYRLRMDVAEVAPFSRFVIFQTGADNYACTREKKLAVGNEGGWVREWDAQWGGDSVRGAPIELNGTAPWASLHATEGNTDTDKTGAWASRGIVIREWKAMIGGKEVRPWMQERGLDRGRAADTSILELVPPPGVKRLEPGDHIEAVIEHLILPQHAEDYYGPNDAFRIALGEDADTWRMAQRHAAQGDVKVEMKRGRLLRRFPDVRIAAEAGAAECVLSGGSGWVTITFTGLRSHREGVVMVDGKPLDQSVHGSDFWQTDFDPAARTWSRTYNLPASSAARVVTFFNQP